MRIGIAGWASVAPSPEIPVSLDELIYSVTAAALQNAGLTIDDIDGVSMAASDLNDGRAISTMTLTGSTGSFHRSEMRVCNESLAALWLGAAEIGSGAAKAIMVCTWSKLSDTQDPLSIDALSMEPVMNRALNYHPDAVLSLRRSFELGEIVPTVPTARYPMDTASAMIIVAGGDDRSRPVRVTGSGSAMGPYLRPGEPVLQPVAKAAEAALRSSRLTATDLGAVRVVGMSRVSSAEFAAALGVAESVIIRQAPVGIDLGYAGGLTAVTDALVGGVDRPTLFVSAGGLGLENAHAIVLEAA